MNRTPSTKRLYRAVVERDASFEGVFWVGVRTTGVFCRPGCKAKAPKADNCEYFANIEDALRAGYRACLRCKPLLHGRSPSPVVDRLIDLIDRDSNRRLTEDDIRALGVDPSTARRQFKKHCGLTFHAYQRARRMKSALTDLRRNGDMFDAMEVSGYESLSGFGSAFNGVFGQPPSAAKRVNCLLTERIDTPLGSMTAIADEHTLHLLDFHDRRALEREVAWIRRRFDATIVPGRNAILSQIAAELAEYFAGRLTRFRTPVKLEGSAFQVRVWERLLKIPHGETMSYGDLAKSIGSPDAQRAVGRANGENRLAIIVPCHRVIRSDGQLCGYGGGLWRKQRLLEIESRTANEITSHRPTGAESARPCVVNRA